MLYDLQPQTIPLADGAIEIRRSGFEPAVFVSCATGHPLVQGFDREDFRYWFDAMTGRIEPFLSTAIHPPESWQAILATGYCQWGKPSIPAHAASELRLRNGHIRVCQLRLHGRIKANPPARAFAHRLLSHPRTGP